MQQPNNLMKLSCLSHGQIEIDKFRDMDIFSFYSIRSELINRVMEQSGFVYAFEDLFVVYI